MNETTATTPDPPPAPAKPSALAAATRALLQHLEIGPDAIEFVHNGIARFHFPTGDADTERIIRVRRPFLGELKRIRLALEEAQEEIAATSTKVTAIAEEITTEANELAVRKAALEITDDEYDAATADIRRRDKAGARQMDDAQETALLAWWGLVFTGEGEFRGLALDAVPDQMEWPAWILEPRLPNRILGHFRQVPSGPG